LQHPFDPDADLPTGRLLIQDADLRARILSLFQFAPGQPEQRVVGQATVFRLDAWGNCATAFHVFEDVFYLGGANGREMLVRQDRSIVALEVEGLVYGAPHIQRHQWRPINGAYSIIKIDDLPLQAPRIRNFTELLALSILPSSHKTGGTEFLNVDLSTWRPSLGEVVLGIGYPNLDKAEKDAPDDRSISQCMYGAYGRITNIEPLDLSRSRPWPMVRVVADWPGGMSGGPVFNAAGNVIGIISSGIDATSSSAMIFGRWNAVHRTFGSLDPARPGWFLCYGTLDTNERLIDIALDRPEAEASAARYDGAFVSRLSLHHATSRFVRLEL
jgi:serine protease Do